MTDKFEIFPQNVTKDGTLIIIKKGMKLYNINDIVKLLHKLTEKNNNLKKRNNRWKSQSHNAHQFLKCYEKAINDLEKEYDNNPVAREVLTKLDKYYTKYENRVELK